MELWVVLLVAAGAFALVDWWAVAGDRRAVEYWAKPLTMALLVGVAAMAGDVAGGVRAALVVGAVLGLVGDVMLMFDTESTFMAGLGAFAAGHLAYAVAAAGIGFDGRWAAIGIGFMVVLLLYRFATHTVPGARRHGGSTLANAVVFYACVITAMVVTAWGTTLWVAAVGACAFAASDWVLGHQRFAGPLPGGRLSVIIPYHVGQALLIIGLTQV
jgi:uncharacterized membrane protein YhhN